MNLRLSNPKPTPHAAKVIVVRDDGVLASGVKAKVLVEGHELAGLFQHDRLEFYVSAGDHILSVDPTPNFGTGVKEHQFIFHPDQTSYMALASERRLSRFAACPSFHAL